MDKGLLVVQEIKRKYAVHCCLSALEWCVYWNASILVPAGEADYWLQGQHIKTQFILSTTRPKFVMVFVNKNFPFFRIKFEIRF